jgi:hypothetical protein
MKTSSISLDLSIMSISDQNFDIKNEQRQISQNFSGLKKRLQNEKFANNKDLHT